MNVKRLLGLDIRAADYAYATDPVMGHTSARKYADTMMTADYTKATAKLRATGACGL